jgi:hypothetical protein
VQAGIKAKSSENGQLKNAISKRTEANAVLAGQIRDK